MKDAECHKPIWDTRKACWPWGLVKCHCPSKTAISRLQALLSYLPHNSGENHSSFHQMTGACARVNNEQSFLIHTSFGARQSAACLFPVTLNCRRSSISRQRSVYSIHNVYKRWRRLQTGYPIFHFKRSAEVHRFDRPANATPSLGVVSGKTNFRAITYGRLLRHEIKNVLPVSVKGSQWIGYWTWRSSHTWCSDRLKLCGKGRFSFLQQITFSRPATRLPV